MGLSLNVYRILAGLDPIDFGVPVSLWRRCGFEPVEGVRPVVIKHVHYYDGYGVHFIGELVCQDCGASKHPTKKCWCQVRKKIRPDKAVGPSLSAGNKRSVSKLLDTIFKPDKSLDRVSNYQLIKSINTGNWAKHRKMGLPHEPKIPPAARRDKEIMWFLSRCAINSAYARDFGPFSELMLHRLSMRLKAWTDEKVGEFLRITPAELKRLDMVISRYIGCVPRIKKWQYGDEESGIKLPLRKYKVDVASNLIRWFFTGNYKQSQVLSYQVVSAA